MRENVQDKLLSKEHCPTLVISTAHLDGADFGCAWCTCIPLKHTAQITCILRPYLPLLGACATVVAGSIDADAAVHRRACSRLPHAGLSVTAVALCSCSAPVSRTHCVPCFMAWQLRMPCEPSTCSMRAPRPLAHHSYCDGASFAPRCTIGVLPPSALPGDAVRGGFTPPAFFTGFSFRVASHPRPTYFQVKYHGRIIVESVWARACRSKPLLACPYAHCVYYSCKASIMCNNGSHYLRRSLLAFLREFSILACKAMVSNTTLLCFPQFTISAV